MRREKESRRFPPRRLITREFFETIPHSWHECKGTSMKFPDNINKRKIIISPKCHYNSNNGLRTGSRFPAPGLFRSGRKLRYPPTDNIKPHFETHANIRTPTPFLLPERRDVNRQISFSYAASLPRIPFPRTEGEKFAIQKCTEK